MASQLFKADIRAASPAADPASRQAVALLVGVAIVELAWFAFLGLLLYHLIS